MRNFQEAYQYKENPMQKILIVCTLLFSIIMGICSCAPKADIAAEKAAIEGVVHASIGWAKEKDKELLYQCFAHDENLFYFSPANSGTIMGFEALQELVDGFFMQDAFQAIRYEVKDLRINLSHGGEVAWYSAYLDDFNEWNGQPASWINVRWTGTLEKRDGQWVIVQMHFSSATDEEGA
jgi:hypothetical protein